MAQGKESACQCRRCRFDPWVRKIPWRRKWKLTPVFLPGESHGQRTLVDYSPQGRKRVCYTLATKQQTTLEFFHVVQGSSSFFILVYFLNNGTQRYSLRNTWNFSICYLIGGMNFIGVIKLKMGRLFFIIHLGLVYLQGAYKKEAYIFCQREIKRCDDGSTGQRVLKMPTKSFWFWRLWMRPWT